MIKTTLTIVAATAALVLGGCATQAQTGALVGGVIGAAVLGPIGSGAAAHAGGAIVGALIGGFIGGSIGKSMDKHDQMKAQRAVDTNKTTTWTNSETKNTYTVTPKDMGNGTAEVKVESNGAVETTTVKKKIRE